MFAGNFAPRGWMKCKGQLLNIADNTSLFSILGVTYGGNGRSTFGLPDLRGRAPIGSGNDPGLTPAILGEKRGTETITLSNENLPSHNYQVKTENSELSEVPMSMESESGMTTVPHPTSPGVITSGNTGSNVPFTVMQPTTAMTYIICIEGHYPSRH